MDSVWNVTLILIGILVCITIGYIVGHIRGYKRGAHWILEEWKKTLQETGGNRNE